MSVDGMFFASFFVTVGLMVVVLILGALKLRIPTVIVGVLSVVGGFVTSMVNAAVSRGTSPIVVLAPAVAIALAAVAVALAYRARRPVAAAPADAPLSVVSAVALVVSFFVSVGGIVLGYLGLRDTGTSTKRGRRLAQAAVILGWIGFAVGVIAGSFLVWQVLYSSGVIRY